MEQHHLNMISATVMSCLLCDAQTQELKAQQQQQSAQIQQMQLQIKQQQQQQCRAEQQQQCEAGHLSNGSANALGGEAILQQPAANAIATKIYEECLKRPHLRDALDGTAMKVF